MGNEEESPESKESKIPPLNAEDPLFGLTDAQVQESLAIFGKNDVSVLVGNVS